MLVMRRREGEAIIIGSDIEIHIITIGRTKVKIGINAPRRISVMAFEVELIRKENLAAARSEPPAGFAVTAPRILGPRWRLPASLPSEHGDTSEVFGLEMTNVPATDR